MRNSKWGAIFDVDGTMVDNKDFHEKAWIELCRRYGMNLTSRDYRMRIHARPNDRIIPDIFGTGISKEKANSIAFEKETIYRELYRPHLKPVPGLLELLNQLKIHGIPCAAASNSPSGNVDLVLDELHIRGHFCSVVCADDVTNGKPDPEIFLVSAVRLHLAPEQCIVFEDSAQGFEAARRARTNCIAITAGANKECLSGISGLLAMHTDYTDIKIETIQKYLTNSAQ